MCNVWCVSNTYNVRVRCVSNTRTYNVRVIFSQSEMSIMYILYHILKVWGGNEGVPAYKLRGTGVQSSAMKFYGVQSLAILKHQFK